MLGYPNIFILAQIRKHINAELQIEGCGVFNRIELLYTWLGGSSRRSGPDTQKRKKSQSNISQLGPNLFHSILRNKSLLKG